jgi:hypothetical protein
VNYFPPLVLAVGVLLLVYGLLMMRLATTRW